MRIFFTGATGFIGTAVVPELIQAGHTVLGLTRSDAGAQALQSAGAEVFRGDLEDLDSLKRGAADAEGVIHTAFDHNFSGPSSFLASCEKDRRAIEAIGSVLAGSSRPFLITSGVAMGQKVPGEVATEDVFNAEHPSPRKSSEIAARAESERGVNVTVVRLPQVHDTVKQGLVSYMPAQFRQKGRAAYIGDGQTRWSAGHISDVARLYRLAIERAEPGARYHAVAEEGVPLRDIVEALAAGLKLPVASVAQAEAEAEFGWLSAFVRSGMAASSSITRQKLGWQPTGPGLIADLQAMDYSRL